MSTPEEVKKGLIKKRGYERAKFTRQKKNIDELLKSKEAIDVTDLTLMFERLQVAFNKEERLTEEVLALVEEGSDEAIQEVNALSAKEDLFFSVKGMVQKIVSGVEKKEREEKAAAESSQASASVNNSIGAIQALQFAHTDIDEYDGNPLGYQEFIDSFTECFHKNPTISDG